MKRLLDWLILHAIVTPTRPRVDPTEGIARLTLYPERRRNVRAELIPNQSPAHGASRRGARPITGGSRNEQQSV